VIQFWPRLDGSHTDADVNPNVTLMLCDIDQAVCDQGSQDADVALAGGTWPPAARMEADFLP
jgi:hypothetical protein